MAIKLIYKDEIPGVAEGATVAVSVEPENFSTPSLLPFGANTGGIATLEPNGWGLTHDYKVKGRQSFGFWSSEISDSEGNFTNPPVIKVQLDSQYLITGVTLWFSPDTGDYCSVVNIIWYQGDTVIRNEDFAVDGAAYEIEALGEMDLFDKVVVTLKKTHLPNRRAKLEMFKMGIIRHIDGTELETVNIIREIDLIGDTLPSGVLDASFLAPRESNIVFQNKQVVEVYNDDELLGEYFINSGQRESETRYSFSATDYTSMLSDMAYAPSDDPGDGMWFVGSSSSLNTSARDILDVVFDGVVPYTISDDLINKHLFGYISHGSKLDALRQVLFALDACADFSNPTEGIKIYRPSTAYTIPPTETYNDGIIEMGEFVESVTVWWYYFRNERPGALDGVSGEYWNKHPLGYWSGAVQTDSGIWYCNKGTATVSRQLPANVHGKHLVFDGCYLTPFTTKDSDELIEQAQILAKAKAERILEYYSRRKKYTFSHVHHSEEVGGKASAVLPWGNTVTGDIIKMNLSFSGITKSETTMLLNG